MQEASHNDGQQHVTYIAVLQHVFFSLLFMNQVLKSLFQCFKWKMFRSIIKMAENMDKIHTHQKSGPQTSYLNISYFKANRHSCGRRYCHEILNSLPLFYVKYKNSTKYYIVRQLLSESWLCTIIIFQKIERQGQHCVNADDCHSELWHIARNITNSLKNFIWNLYLCLNYKQNINDGC